MLDFEKEYSSDIVIITVNISRATVKEAHEFKKFIDDEIAPTVTITEEDIKKHYNDQITANGMKKAFDDVGLHGIGVVTWVDTMIKNKKYLMQFVPGDSDLPPWTFIMYSHPD